MHFRLKLARPDVTYDVIPRNHNNQIVGKVFQDRCCCLSSENIPRESSPFLHFYIFLLAARLGFVASNPGLSCKHIRDAGDSIGDGEYWIDPEINRNPFKVYCDMTTDGGSFFIFTSVFINELQTSAFIVSSSK